MIIGIVQQNEVKDLTTFCQYIQQQLGTPVATIDDKKILGRNTKLFFAANPNADWRTLCKVVQWAKDKRKRPTRVHQITSYVNYAWKGRYLPELDAAIETAIDKRVLEILQVENDDDWRERLMLSTGATLSAVVVEWEAQHATQALPADQIVMDLGLPPKKKTTTRKARSPRGTGSRTAK